MRRPARSTRRRSHLCHAACQSRRARRPQRRPPRPERGGHGGLGRPAPAGVGKQRGERGANLGGAHGQSIRRSVSASIFCHRLLLPVQARHRLPGRAEHSRRPWQRQAPSVRGLARPARRHPRLGRRNPAACRGAISARLDLRLHSLELPLPHHGERTAEHRHVRPVKRRRREFQVTAGGPASLRSAPHWQIPRPQRRDEADQRRACKAALRARPV